MSQSLDTIMRATMSGFLFKRRGGFGKMMPNAWQLRYFVLTDGFLLYYDTKDTSQPERSKIDLAGDIDIQFSGHNEGSPTSYIIQIIPMNSAEERWKLCAESQKDHQEWASFLGQFLQLRAQNGVPARLAYASGANAGISSLADRPSDLMSPIARPSSPDLVAGQTQTTSASNVTREVDSIEILRPTAGTLPAAASISATTPTPISTSSPTKTSALLPASSKGSPNKIKSKKTLKLKEGGFMAPEQLELGMNAFEVLNKLPSLLLLLLLIMLLMILFTIFPHLK
jgi:hypothetical protein